MWGRMARWRPPPGCAPSNGTLRDVGEVASADEWTTHGPLGLARFGRHGLVTTSPGPASTARARRVRAHAGARFQQRGDVAQGECKNFVHTDERHHLRRRTRAALRRHRRGHRDRRLRCRLPAARHAGHLAEGGPLLGEGTEVAGRPRRPSWRRREGRRPVRRSCARGLRARRGRRGRRVEGEPSCPSSATPRVSDERVPPGRDAVLRDSGLRAVVDGSRPSGASRSAAPVTAGRTRAWAVTPGPPGGSGGWLPRARQRPGHAVDRGPAPPPLQRRRRPAQGAAYAQRRSGISGLARARHQEFARYCHRPLALAARPGLASPPGGQRGVRRGGAGGGGVGAVGPGDDVRRDRRGRRPFGPRRVGPRDGRHRRRARAVVAGGACRRLAAAEPHDGPAPPTSRRARRCARRAPSTSRRRSSRRTWPTGENRRLVRQEHGRTVAALRASPRCCPPPGEGGVAAGGRGLEHVPRTGGVLLASNHLSLRGHRGDPGRGAAAPWRSWPSPTTSPAPA